MKKNKKSTRPQYIKKTLKTKKAMVLCFVLVFSLIGGYLVYKSQAATSYYTTSRAFLDISSPQCGSLSKIGGGRHYGIVGLNGTYMAFGTNPCVYEEVKLFERYDLYVGANYPSSHCPGLSAFDCGLKAAQHNANLIRYLQLKPSIIWIDVESGPGIPWSANKADNSAFILGLAAGAINRGYVVGYYSTENMWNNITGGIKVTSGPVWYATGQHSATAAKLYCGKSFGGRKATYVQYIDTTRNLDINVRCY